MMAQLLFAPDSPLLGNGMKLRNSAIPSCPSFRKLDAINEFPNVQDDITGKGYLPFKFGERSTDGSQN